MRAGKLLIAAAAFPALLLLDFVPVTEAEQSTSSPGVASARASQTPADPRRPAEVARVEVREELAITRWLEPGEYAWNDEGAPEGPTVIVVNIRGRVLSVYRGGVEIGRSSILYGADDKPTPTGTFAILEKKKDHVSNLYNAPMPHMLRLTWDGIAIHGSPEVADDAATRGCVGLPEEFARLMFRVAKVGDRVVIWSGTAAV
jgi:lipoprotein-anchoring transpeptidase ErfK/SrfK